MSDNVIKAAFRTRLAIDPDRVLSGALNASLESVTVIGRTTDGEAYYASSHGYIPDLLLEVKLYEADLLERASETDPA